MRRLPAHKAKHFEPSYRFRAAVGRVEFAEWCDGPAALARRKGRTQAQKRGLAFERRALQFLSASLGEFKSGPWIRWHTRDDEFLCQPDGLCEISDYKVFVFECKSRHCIEAYWQLRHLYVPVVRRLYPNREIIAVEVT